MPKPITALGFRGMNNLEQAPGILLDDAKRITPRIALNVEVTDGGKLVRRKGYALEIPLSGAHSLWAGSIMLVVAAGILYRIDGDAAVSFGAVSGPKTPVCYVELDNLIYMATPTWQAIYDLLDGSIRDLGTLPAGHPGNYHRGRGYAPRDLYPMLHRRPTPQEGAVSVATAPWPRCHGKAAPRESGWTTSRPAANVGSRTPTARTSSWRPSWEG